MGFAWPFLLDALTPFGAMEGLPAIEITHLNHCHFCFKSENLKFQCWYFPAVTKSRFTRHVKISTNCPKISHLKIFKTKCHDKKEKKTNYFQRKLSVHDYLNM